MLNARPAASAIPEPTRRRIRERARALHYRPNVLARALRRGRASAIGVLVPDFAAVGSAFAQGVADTLRIAGYDVMLATHHRRPELVAGRAHLMMERQVDGLIVADGEELEGTPVPIVNLTYTNGRETASTARVILNLETSADAAVGHLVDLGHRFLTVLSAPTPFGSAWGRALSRSAGRRGIRLDTKPSETGYASDFERGYLEAQALIDCRHRSTAVFAPDDATAIGVIRAFRERNLDVPRDVSVIGFGGYGDAAAYAPRLSTVSVPAWEAGERAALLLVGQIERRVAVWPSPLAAIFSAQETTDVAAARPRRKR